MRCPIAYPDFKDPSIIDVRKLAAAILEIAVNDIAGAFSAGNGDDYKNKEQTTRRFIREGLIWVNSGDSLDQAGSFLWCCYVCELDPEAVKERLNSGKLTKIKRTLLEPCGRAYTNRKYYEKRKREAANK